MRRAPSCRSQKPSASQPRMECTTTLAEKVSGVCRTAGCSGCAIGATVTPSSTPAQSCWTICRSSTSTPRRDRSLASGMAARCTTRSRAVDAGWNGTSCRTAVPNHTNVLWPGAGCGSDPSWHWRSTSIITSTTRITPAQANDHRIHPCPKFYARLVKSYDIDVNRGQLDGLTFSISE